MVQKTPKQVPFHQVLAALLDDLKTFPALYLHQFSDLVPVDIGSLRAVWSQVNLNRRIALLEDLETLAESDTLVMFDEIAMLGLEDEDPRVRQIAIRLLWESTDRQLPQRFIQLLLHDPDLRVRAAVAAAMAHLVYQGELDEIPQAAARKVEDVLLKIVQSQEDPLVRRAALESLGYSSRDEVPPLIQQAYQSGDQPWLLSALVAIGRSAAQEWEPQVLQTLNHHETEIQAEAVRAAGELGLESARRPLIKLLDDELLDEEVRAAVIWSLSQIGGEEVRETLDLLLENTEDEDEVEFIEEALDNLNFTDEASLFGTLGITGEDEEDVVAKYLARKGENPADYGYDLDLDLSSLDTDETDSGNDAPKQKPSDSQRHRHKKY